MEQEKINKTSCLKYLIIMLLVMAFSITLSAPSIYARGPRQLTFEPVGNDNPWDEMHSIPNTDRKLYSDFEIIIMSVNFYFGRFIISTPITNNFYYKQNRIDIVSNERQNINYVGQSRNSSSGR